jgi:hypothetical protein
MADASSSDNSPASHFFRMIRCVPSHGIADAVGVGHIFTCALSFGSPRLFHFPITRSTASSATGVCHKPKSVPLMRRPNIGSSQHCPPAVIPERGQVTKHSSESPSNESWTVFHEDESGSNLANNPCHVSPHPRPLSINARSLACDADVLARKAARYDVNNASPRSAVKGLNVIPNREGRENAVILSGGKYACGVGFPLDGANGAPSEQVSAKYSSTSAREKSQLI